MSEARGVNGTVSFDGTFVTIRRTGVLARLTIGKGEKRIPLWSITAVQWKPPGWAVRGYVAFTLGGGNEKQSQFGRQSFDAGRDENAVLVTRRQVAQFLVLRSEIETALRSQDQRR